VKEAVMSSLDFHQFLCRSDNYAVLARDRASGKTVLIDVPEERAVIKAMEETGWTPDLIFITHYHNDHIAGLATIKTMTGADVIVPETEKDSIAVYDQTVAEDDDIMLGETTFKVIETPGHTKGHVVYYSEEGNVLFAGDTLFSLGCGRLFEDTAEAMWYGLEKLKRLPDETLLFCGHEYTSANADFALSLEPENGVLLAYAEKIKALRAQNKPTLPSTLGHEKALNPFLRADDPVLKDNIGMENVENSAVFAHLRRKKDHF
jgi:hydroxyacylglutathione hydrolase